MAKHLLIIDGQGGKIGAQLVRSVLDRFPDLALTAVGTNSAATAAMIKSGASVAATGENAAIVACRKADVIVGPIGIVLADALFGEVTPAMAAAVAQADAVRVLLPMGKCHTVIAGARALGTAAILSDALEAIESALGEG